MKKTLLLFLVVILSGCAQQEIKEYKFNGAEGISCYVNGELLLPRGGGLGGNARARQDSENFRQFLTISYFDNQYGGFKSLRMLIYTTGEDFSGKEFDLKSAADGAGFGTFQIAGKDYDTNNIQSGKLGIIYHNVGLRFITGYFYFDAIDEDGNVVQVRDGKFDIRIN